MFRQPQVGHATMPLWAHPSGQIAPFSFSLVLAQLSQLCLRFEMRFGRPRPAHQLPRVGRMRSYFFSISGRVCATFSHYWAIIADGVGVLRAARTIVRKRAKVSQSWLASKEIYLRMACCCHHHLRQVTTDTSCDEESEHLIKTDVPSHWELGAKLAESMLACAS